MQYNDQKKQEQTTIYKTLHRTFEQHEAHETRGLVINDKVPDCDYYTWNISMYICDADNYKDEQHGPH